MTSYADHPRQVVEIPRLAKYSTAAGRYQIMVRIFDAYKVQLDLPDFSPLSQDKIAMQLTKECHAIDEIEAGKIALAVASCKSRWASFPDSLYGQGAHGTMAQYIDQYAVLLARRMSDGAPVPTGAA
jgi:muramidase (phage lysozyme)